MNSVTNVGGANKVDAGGARCVAGVGRANIGGPFQISEDVNLLVAVLGGGRFIAGTEPADLFRDIEADR